MTDLAARQPETEPAPFALVADHAHHWKIAAQNGPSSEGTCKSCGATRDFTNAYFKTYRSPMFLGRTSRNRPTSAS
jgi:hypothetical protein